MTTEHKQLNRENPESEAGSIPLMDVRVLKIPGKEPNSVTTW
jgi:hypothetical protein